MIEQPWRYLFARPPSPRCLAPKNLLHSPAHTHPALFSFCVSFNAGGPTTKGAEGLVITYFQSRRRPPPLASPAARPPENATRRDARPYFLLLCWPAVFWLFLSVCARLYGAVPPRDSLSTLCRPPSPAVLTHWPADHPGEPPTGDSLLPLLPFLLYPSTGWLPLFSFRDCISSLLHARSLASVPCRSSISSASLWSVLQSHLLQRRDCVYPFRLDPPRARFAPPSASRYETDAIVEAPAQQRLIESTARAASLSIRIIMQAS